MDPAAFVTQVGPMIEAYPEAAVTLAVVVGGLSFGAAWFLRKNQIDDFESRLKRRDEEIAALQKQVSNEAALGEDRKKEIRRALTGFLSEAGHLQAECRIQDREVPQAEKREWLNRVVAYLNANLDESYSARLISDSIADSMRPAGNLTGEQVSNWRWFRTRMMWLNRFIQEFT